MPSVIFLSQRLWQSSTKHEPSSDEAIKADARRGIGPDGTVVDSVFHRSVCSTNSVESMRGMGWISFERPEHNYAQHAEPWGVLQSKIEETRSPSTKVC